MNNRGLIAGILLLAGCGKPNEAGNVVANARVPEAPPAPAAPSAPQAPPDSMAPSPTNRRVLIEPKGPIDPKSVEAAGQVVQHYGALIEQGRWTASRAYWGSVDAAQAFERNFRSYADVHLEIGDLGETEGAAGSIYVTEPVVFYGRKNGSGTYRRAAVVTLRRVNDVPGSTAAQRRWHIERIDWKGAA
jgi:hypothetical protein